MLTVKPGNRLIGDRAQYFRKYGQRKTSYLVKFGAPAKRHPLQQLDNQGLRLIHSHESFEINLAVMQELQSLERFVQDKGMEWMAYQIQEAGRRHGNTRIATVATTLRYGAIYWDANGNLLPSSSGAAETYSFNIPATHQNQLNGIIAVSWLNNNADIPGDIQAIQEFALQETGMPLETVLYGKNVRKAVTTNDLMQSFLARNQVWGDKFISTGVVPTEVFGLEWRPAWTLFYEDQTGTVQPLWDDNMAVFLPKLAQPDDMSDWWAFYEGSYPCPKSLEIAADPKAMLSDRNFETVYGQFGYARPSTEVPGWDCHHGDTWLGALRNERAIFQSVPVF